MMSSIKPGKEKANAALENHSISIQNQLPEATEDPIRMQPVRNNVLQTCFVILFYLIISILVACVALPIAAIGISLVLANLAVAPVVVLPLLLVSLLVARLLQFLRHELDYDSLAQLKLLIRTWIFIDLGLLVFELGILLVISINVDAVKDVILIGLPLTNWVKMMLIICGIYCLSYALLVVTYVILRFLLGLGSDGFGVPEALAEVIDCLLLWWAEYEVMKRVPNFKHSKILGLDTRNWIGVSIFVVIGYNIITLFTHMILWSLRRFISPKLDPGVDTHSTRYLLVEKILCRNYLVFCVNWLRSDITFILTSLLLLLTWEFYFCSRLTETNRAKDVMEFGKQLYFLGIISRHKYDIFSLKYETNARRQVAEDNEISGKKEEKDERSGCLGLLYVVFLMLKQASLSKSDEVGKPDSEDEWEEETVNQRFGKRLSTKKRKKIKKELLLKNRTATLFDTEQVGKYLLMTKNPLSKEMNILEMLATINLYDGNGSFKENLKQIMDGKNKLNVAQGSCNGVKSETENSDFEALLTYVDFSEEMTSEQLGRWMERSQNNCELLANTINSAKEVADCLNKTTSWLLVGVTFIMWLLLTGLATTKVLVLIASPLLAATFIFGDTCKSLFQGIIFVFVVHPFDVGDLCFIDDKLMEVKAIGVWTTTFSKIDKVGTQDEVIYPNSELASKVILNHRTEFDCNDYVEFNFGFLDDEKIEKLKSRIEDHLKDESTRFRSSTCHSVAVLTTDNGIKLGVRFEHKIDLSGKTYFECLKEKDKLRSAFILRVQNLTKDKDVPSS